MGDGVVWRLDPQQVQLVAFLVGVGGVVSWWRGLDVVNGALMAHGVGRTVEVLVATAYLSLGTGWLAATGVVVLGLGRLGTVR